MFFFNIWLEKLLLKLFIDNIMLLKSSCSFITLHGKRNVIRQKDTKNTINGTSEQNECLKEFVNKKNTYIRKENNSNEFS